MVRVFREKMKKVQNSGSVIAEGSYGRPQGDLVPQNRAVMLNLRIVSRGPVFFGAWFERKQHVPSKSVRDAATVPSGRRRGRGRRASWCVVRNCAAEPAPGVRGMPRVGVGGGSCSRNLPGPGHPSRISLTYRDQTRRDLATHGVTWRDETRQDVFFPSRNHRRSSSCLVGWVEVDGPSHLPAPPLPAKGVCR